MGMGSTIAGFFGHMDATDQADQSTEPPLGLPSGEEQPALAFVPADPHDRLRTRLGSWVLVKAAPRTMMLAHRLAGRRRTHRIERRWARAVTRLLRLDVAVTGLDHVDPAGRYLVMPLHEGFVDVPVLAQLPLDLRFTVRDELFDLPDIGRYLATTGQIPVFERPSRADLRTFYADVGQALGTGESVVVFPQGSILGVEVAFRPGIQRLAQRFDVPVLPVVLTGTHRVWEHPYTPKVRLDQTVSLDVLAPIPASEVSAEGLRRVERTMKARAVANQDAPVRRFDPDRDGWWDDYRYEIDPDFADLHARWRSRRSASGPTAPSTRTHLA